MSKAEVGLREVYKQQTRKKILRSARRCFYYNGFERTSVDDIAASAKVGRATVYLHFSGKAEILREIIGENLKDQLEYYRKLVTLPEPLARSDVHEWVLGMITTLIRVRRSLGEFAVVLIENEEAANQIAANRLAQIRLLGTRYPRFRVAEAATDEARRSLHECQFLLYLVETYPRYAAREDEPMLASGIDVLTGKFMEMLAG